eukprot:scaffold273520_cov40-Tisochrysis_lutea.AAC.1
MWRYRLQGIGQRIAFLINLLARLPSMQASAASTRLQSDGELRRALRVPAAGIRQSTREHGHAATGALLAHEP